MSLIPTPPTGSDAPRVRTDMTLVEAVSSLGIELESSVLTIEGLEELVQLLENSGSSEVRWIELFFLFHVLGEAHVHFDTQETNAKYQLLWERLKQVVTNSRSEG